jgi:hypothetical protein
MALAAAAAFLLCGIGVILLEGSLMTAIVTGLVAGGSALVLAAKLTGRRLKMCSQQ